MISSLFILTILTYGITVCMEIPFPIYSNLLILAYFCVGLLFDAIMYISSDDDDEYIHRIKVFIGYYFLIVSGLLHIVIITLINPNLHISWLFCCIGMVYYNISQIPNIIQSHR